MNVETPEIVASRIRRALPYVPGKDIIIAPDCGMKYLTRDIAFGKMRAMVEGAKIIRAEVECRPLRTSSDAPRAAFSTGRRSRVTPDVVLPLSGA